MSQDLYGMFIYSNAPEEVLSWAFEYCMWLETTRPPRFERDDMPVPHEIYTQATRAWMSTLGDGTITDFSEAVLLLAQIYTASRIIKLVTRGGPND